jgi:hypothetical protein
MRRTHPAVARLMWRAALQRTYLASVPGAFAISEAQLRDNPGYDRNPYNSASLARWTRDLAREYTRDGRPRQLA